MFLAQLVKVDCDFLVTYLDIKLYIYNGKTENLAVDVVKTQVRSQKTVNLTLQQLFSW